MTKSSGSSGARIGDGVPGGPMAIHCQDSWPPLGSIQNANASDASAVEGVSPSMVKRIAGRPGMVVSADTLLKVG